MDEQQLQQQIVQLVQAAMQGDKQATQQIQQIMQAAQQGDQQAAQLAQMIQEVAQQMQQQQVQAAKFGAKLNYIQHLQGVCPEGYEMQLFKQGGQICRKCIKKAMMEDGGNTPQNLVDAFKCGRKMKKKAKGGSNNRLLLEKKETGGMLQDNVIAVGYNGGKQRRPFTGFEGLSYQYEAANPSIQSRASRPADEWITNNGKMIMGRETWYDPVSNQPEDVGYYYPGYSAERDWEAPNEQTQQTRTFNSLKRHALMNQQLREPKFACGGPVKKDQNGGEIWTMKQSGFLPRTTIYRTIIPPKPYEAGVPDTTYQKVVSYGLPFIDDVSTSGSVTHDRTGYYNKVGGGRTKAWTNKVSPSGRAIKGPYNTLKKEYDKMK